MSLGILMDQETAQHVDYVFLADVCLGRCAQSEAASGHGSAVTEVGVRLVCVL